MSTSICSRVRSRNIEWSIWWWRRIGHSLVSHSAENGNHVAVPHANYSMLPGHRIGSVRIGCPHKMLDASLRKCLHHPERQKKYKVQIFQRSVQSNSMVSLLISQMQNVMPSRNAFLAHSFVFVCAIFTIQRILLLLRMCWGNALYFRSTTSYAFESFIHALNVIFTVAKSSQLQKCEFSVWLNEPNQNPTSLPTPPTQMTDFSHESMEKWIYKLFNVIYLMHHCPYRRISPFHRTALRIKVMRKSQLLLNWRIPLRSLRWICMCICLFE